VGKFNVQAAVDFTRYETELKLYAIDALEIDIMGTEGQRFYARQLKLFLARISPTMKSDHLKCCARDIDVVIDGKVITDGSHWAYAKMGAFWKTLHPGCYWGGDFRSKDSRHFGFKP
jgi:hypothetical protein